jgi:hypothetical protein
MDLIIGVIFMLSGPILYWRAGSSKAYGEQESKEFVPSQFSAKSLRFGGVGIFLVGALMLAGKYLHLL